MSGHVTCVYHTARPIHFRRRATVQRRCWTLATAPALLGTPAIARAPGPIDPEASSDLAHITHTPAGARAKIVDGDLRLWMSVAPSLRLVTSTTSRLGRGRAGDADVATL